MQELKNQDYYKNSTWKTLPDTVMIELTNSCNFSCIMCSNKHMSREKGFMTYETFKKSLDRCGEAGIKQIKLYTTGESLLHPNFMDFWNLAITHPFDTIMISTNGSLLTEEMLTELVKSDKLRIQFSFSGWDKQSYEMRYFGGNFESVIAKIKLTKSMIHQAGLPDETLTINAVASKTTGALKKTSDFLKNELSLKNEQIKIHYQNNWTDVVKNKEENKLRLRGDEKNKEQSTHNKKYYCHIANTRMGILYDGQVTACGCLDVNGGLVVGNISDSSIQNIRAGKNFLEFIRKLDTGDISSLMCRNCDSLKWIK